MSWKDGLSKKLCWNMIFLVLSGNMIFLFPENMILHLRRKMKDDLSEKIHGNMIFSSNFLKRWSSQKGPRRHMIFLVLSAKMAFFFPKIWYFFPGQKVKDGLSQQIHGNMMHCSPAKKNRKPNIEVWAPIKEIICPLGNRL